MAERNFRPHINCARMTHDNKYLLVADQGMDHVNVYRFDVEKGKVKLEDIIRSEMESAPRHIKISEDGRYIYILHELKCYIDVYEYANHDNDPTFEKIQTVELIKLTRGNTREIIQSLYLMWIKRQDCLRRISCCRSAVSIRRMRSSSRIISFWCL